MTATKKLPTDGDSAAGPFGMSSGSGVPVVVEVVDVVVVVVDG